jgi:hypothetical protein
MGAVGTFIDRKEASTRSCLAGGGQSGFRWRRFRGASDVDARDHRTSSSPIATGHTGPSHVLPELAEPHSINALGERDLGMFTVADVTAEGAAAPLPTHRVAGFPDQRNPRRALTGKSDGTDPFATAKPDARLIRLLIRAGRFNAALVGSDGVPFAALARREGVSPSYFTRLVRLSYLAPDILQAILDGRQPPDLSADKLLAHSRLPLAWHEQRAVLGFTWAPS